VVLQTELQHLREGIRAEVNLDAVTKLIAGATTDVFAAETLGLDAGLTRAPERGPSLSSGGSKDSEGHDFPPVSASHVKAAARPVVCRCSASPSTHYG
jgi:hypothetical protein